jgi:hypothetical protein
MGREGVLAVPPKFIALSIIEGQMRFAPTFIDFPITQGVRPKLLTFNLQRVNLGGSRGNFNGVRTSAISTNTLRISGGFCQFTFLCHSLYLIDVIICEIKGMSRLGNFLGDADQFSG